MNNEQQIFFSKEEIENLSGSHKMLWVDKSEYVDAIELLRAFTNCPEYELENLKAQARDLVARAAT